MESLWCWPVVCQASKQAPLGRSLLGGLEECTASVGWVTYLPTCLSVYVKVASYMMI